MPIDYQALADRWHELDAIEAQAKKEKDEIRTAILAALNSGIQVVSSHGRTAKVSVAESYSFAASDALPLIMRHGVPVDSVLSVKGKEFRNAVPEWASVPHSQTAIKKLIWAKPK